MGIATLDELQRRHYKQGTPGAFKESLQLIYRQKLEHLRIRADRRDDLLKILLSIAEAHGEGHPYITMSEIEKRTGIRYSTVRRLVDRLVEKDFVDFVRLARPKKIQKKESGSYPKCGFALNHQFEMQSSYEALRGNGYYLLST